MTNITGDAVAQPCISHRFSLLKPPFLTAPTESTFLNWSLKNLLQVIMSTTSTVVQNLMEICSCGTSWQIGKIYRKIFFFIPLFKQYMSDCSTDFRALWLKWCRLTQGCAFLALVNIASHLGNQIAPKPQFLGRQ